MSLVSDSIVISESLKSAKDLEVEGIIQRIAEAKKVSTMLSGPVEIIGKPSSWREYISNELSQLGIVVMNPEEEYCSEETTNFRIKLQQAMADGDLEWIRNYASDDMVMKNLENIVKSTFVTVYIPKRIINSEIERICKIKNVNERKKELFSSMHEICGTYGEITLAKFLGKPVYVVTDRSLAPCELHAWTVACSEWVFDNFNQYLRFVKATYVN